MFLLSAVHLCGGNEKKRERVVVELWIQETLR